MEELDHFVVANPARIPCTARTLRPYYNAGDLKPWVSIKELFDAVQYLALRSGMPPEEISAIKELHAKLYSLLKDTEVVSD